MYSGNVFVVGQIHGQTLDNVPSTTTVVDTEFMYRFSDAVKNSCIPVTYEHRRVIEYLAVSDDLEGQYLSDYLIKNLYGIGIVISIFKGRDECWYALLYVLDSGSIDLREHSLSMTNNNKDGFEIGIVKNPRRNVKKIEHIGLNRYQAVSYIDSISDVNKSTSVETSIISVHSIIMESQPYTEQDLKNLKENYERQYRTITERMNTAESQSNKRRRTANDVPPSEKSTPNTSGESGHTKPPVKEDTAKAESSNATLYRANQNLRQLVHTKLREMMDITNNLTKVGGDCIMDDTNLISVHGNFDTVQDALLEENVRLLNYNGTLQQLVPKLRCLQSSTSHVDQRNGTQSIGSHMDMEKVQDSFISRAKFSA